MFDQFKVFMGGNPQFFQTPEVNRAGATISAIYLVALLQQQLGKVRTILTCYACDDD